MFNQKRSAIYKTLAITAQAIFIVLGIILGFTFKTTEYTGILAPVPEHHFNLTLMFITWIISIVPVSLLYAIHIHLGNQEQMIILLKSICPAAPSSSPALRTPQPKDNTSWQCKICGSENAASSSACCKCGWSSQSEGQ